ncbi:hypothetical protein FQA39_LY11541 [Lamprigera yunnana]|nr:hypothetical protein FQA39_LY11541 [Lamprigera yunnana]
MYVLDKISKRNASLKFWRCKYVRGCNGRIHTKSGEVANEINNHSHVTSAANTSTFVAKVAIAVTKIKLRGKDILEGACEVINQCISDLLKAIIAWLPNKSPLRKTIRRKRNQISESPTNTRDLNDLEGPNELVRFSEIKSTRNFSRHNGKSNRVICFNEAIRLEGFQVAMKMTTYILEKHYIKKNFFEEGNMYFKSDRILFNAI